MLRWMVAALALAGCGRTGFDPIIDAGDAGEAAVDDGPLTTGCWPAWRAGTISVSDPVLVTELASASDDLNPFMHADDQQLHFTRGSINVRDVFVARRAGRGQPFGTAMAVSVNTTGDEGRLSLTADGLLAAFTSDRNPATSVDELWFAERPDLQTPFGLASQSEIAAILNTANQSDAELSPDGLRLYWADARTPSVIQRIYVAERASRTEAFGPAALVPGLPAQDTADPTLSPDELVIVVSIETGGSNINDLFFATRNTRTEPFSTPAIVPRVNSLLVNIDDADASLSDDGCELWFSSVRTATRDIYVSTISPL